MSTITLNEQQEAIVALGKGAYLVDAAAGVGKTRVITERMIRLVASGVDANRILLVTFTVRAAHEMGLRVLQRTGRKPLWATNFHRLCTRLLREFPEFGVPAGFTIADADDSKRIIREILRELAPDADPKKFMDMIFKQVERNRDLALWPDREPLTIGAKKEPVVALAAVEYEARLARDNRIDFDLMLYKVALGLRRDPELRRRVTALWDYIMVDEAQDTDPVQLDILKSLSGHGNVVMCGDIDQGIYRFRGAEPRNMHFFVQHFGAKVLPLEVNYRSRAEILETANAVIVHNADRFPKSLKPSKGRGGRVHLRQFGDSRGEASFAAKEIRMLIRSGVAPEQIAVLYRVSAASREMEAMLSTEGVKHRVLGGMRFWDRKDVKDVIAWAKVLCGRLDWDAWKRATQSPRCGIGEAMWARVAQAGHPEDGLSMAAPQKSARMMVALRHARRAGDTAEALKQLLDQAGFLEAIRDESGEGTEEYFQRMGNVHEALGVVRELGSVTAFLDEVVLGFPGSESEDDAKGVTLATIHAAKGLEWDHVFLVQAAEEILPHAYAMRGGEEEIAEERRLLYVAITRARLGLSMSYPTILNVPGESAKIVLPSRFLVEAGLKPRLERAG